MTPLKNHIDELEIINAIKTAEEKTSGEVRIHITQKIKKNVYEDAIKTFNKIGMQRTKFRNGVMVYIVEKDKKFAIIGDKGINDIVGQNFWDKSQNILSSTFQKKEYTKGLCAVIHNIGKILQLHFQYDATATEELPNDISYE